MAFRYKVPYFMGWSQRETLSEYGRLLQLAASQGPAAVKKCHRELGQQDLYFLLTKLIHRADMHHHWIFERCREVQKDPDGWLDLWAREHYKSTIITLGLTLQDIINNPNIGIGLFSHTKDMAKAFLKPLKNEIEDNRDLRYYYDDVFHNKPRSQAKLWSADDGIIVKRTRNRKEPTVSPWGLVDGMPTGMHFDVRVYDDVVTERTVGNPDQIKKATDQWALSQSLGTEGGCQRIAGTTYHLHDPHSIMRERGIPARVYPATSCGTDDTRNAVLKSPHYLAELRKNQGPYIFACQYLLNPLADNVQGFREEWWQTWQADNDANLNKIILVDAASGKRRQEKNANNDYTAMWVLGLGGDNNWYVLDMVRDRLRLTERGAMLMELHRTWRPRKVGYEEYGMQADIEYIEKLQKEENYRFKITPLGGSLAKPDRIKRLIPTFESGGIYMPTSLVRKNWEGRSTDLVRVFKEDEYLKFPVLQHDDMLDGLSRLHDEEMVLAPPAPQKKGWNAIEAAKREMRKNQPVV